MLLKKKFRLKYNQENELKVLKVKIITVNCEYDIIRLLSPMN